MKHEGPRGAVSSARGGGLATRKIPSQIPPFRAEFLSILPSQILRPLAAARDQRRSRRARRGYLAEATRQVSTYVQNNMEWSDGVDDSMERHGAELIDKTDEAQCQAFLAGVGLATLEKRHKRETAIGAAQLELERLSRELVDGN